MSPSKTVTYLVVLTLGGGRVIQSLHIIYLTLVSFFLFMYIVVMGNYFCSIVLSQTILPMHVLRIYSFTVTIDRQFYLK